MIKTSEDADPSFPFHAHLNVTWVNPGAHFYPLSCAIAQTLTIAKLSFLRTAKARHPKEYSNRKPGQPQVRNRRHTPTSGLPAVHLGLVIQCPAQCFSCSLHAKKKEAKTWGQIQENNFLWISTHQCINASAEQLVCSCAPIKAHGWPWVQSSSFASRGPKGWNRWYPWCEKGCNSMSMLRQRTFTYELQVRRVLSGLRTSIPASFPCGSWRGWRLYQWSLFCKSNRHEVYEFDEVLPKHFHNCNLQMVRKESLSCSAVAGVGVGAMLSPAAVNNHINKDRPDSEPIHNRCIWGCGRFSSYCLGMTA